MDLFSKVPPSANCTSLWSQGKLIPSTFTWMLMMTSEWLYLTSPFSWLHTDLSDCLLDTSVRTSVGFSKSTCPKGNSGSSFRILLRSFYHLLKPMSILSPEQEASESWWSFCLPCSISSQLPKGPQVLPFLALPWTSTVGFSLVLLVPLLGLLESILQTSVKLNFPA